jgi:hypothetical protein
MLDVCGRASRSRTARKAVVPIKANYSDSMIFLKKSFLKLFLKIYFLEIIIFYFIFYFILSM